MSRCVGIPERRGSFRYRLVACFTVGLALQAALAPLAAASTAPGAGTDRAPPGPSTNLPAGKAQNRPPSATAAGVAAADSKARADESVPELWRSEEHTSE